jgi:hypothetical protein
MNTAKDVGLSLDSGHDDPGATETAAVLPFMDGIEVSINALMTVQSDYVSMYFFIHDSAVSLCSLVRLTVNLVRCVAVCHVQRQIS